MFSAEGDARVASALHRFLRAAEVAQETEDLAPGAARLAVLQAPGARTASGVLYDEFWGHRDDPLPDIRLPRHMFEPGEYAEGESD